MEIQINKHTKIAMIKAIVSIIALLKLSSNSMQASLESPIKWNPMTFMVEHVKLSFSPKKVNIEKRKKFFFELVYFLLHVILVSVRFRLDAKIERNALLKTVAVVSNRMLA